MLTVIGPSMTVRYQNAAIERILGYTPDDIVGADFLDFIHPDDADNVRQLLGRASDNPEIQQSGSHRMRDASGDWRWILSLAIDQTAEQPVDGIVLNSFEAVRVQPDVPYARALLESVNDGIVIVVDGVITFANDQLSEMIGYQPAELQGKPFDEFVAAEDKPKVRERYTSRMSDEDAEEIYPIHIRTRRGDRIPVELSVSTFEDTEGTGVIVVVRDLRSHISRKRQLRVIDRTLRHNLRNALTAVRGNAEYIREKVSGVEREAKTIVHQIDKLMDFAEKERYVIDILVDSPEPTTIDIGRVCEDRVADIVETHDDVEITVEIDQPAIARATPDIECAVDELLDNAIRHNDRSPVVEVHVKTADDDVKIHISDNGPEIPVIEREAIMQEFIDDPVFHESGLGLWLVYWVVRQSNGSLSFETNEPRGSLVTIELDRMDPSR